MKLKKVSFKEECPTIDVEFELETSESNRYEYTLIAHVIGEYRDGSLGDPDASYLYGQIQTALEVWSPKAVIIDFSRMMYQWGDMLEIVYDAPGDINTAYVVGPDCRSAMSTLENGINSDEDILETTGFFDNIIDTFNYLSNRT